MNVTNVGSLFKYVIGGGWGAGDPEEGTQRVSVIRGADFPQVKVQDLTSLPVRFEGVKSADRRTLEAGDIVLEISGGTRNRPTGRSVFVTESMVSHAANPLIPASFCRLIRPESRRVCPRWLYYHLQAWWNGGGAWGYQNQSTGISNFRFKVFEGEYRLGLPSRALQDAIAEVLGGLDDKIAANQHVIARTDRFLAALFGSHTCGSVTVRLGDVASVNRRVVTPSLDEKIDYLDIGSVREGGFDAPTRMAWSDAPSRARRGLDSGDILWSTVRPNRRSHALYLGSGNGIVASTGLAVLSPVSVSSAELYEATKLSAFQDYLESLAGGSAYPAVRSSVFNDAPLTVLESERRQHFVKIAAPLRQLEWALGEENRRLADTRDELLPLLMNGKITVKDAEKTVEDVV